MAGPGSVAQQCWMVGAKLSNKGEEEDNVEQKEQVNEQKQEQEQEQDEKTTSVIGPAAVVAEAIEEMFAQSLGQDSTWQSLSLQAAGALWAMRRRWHELERMRKQAQRNNGGSGSGSKRRRKRRRK